MLGVMGKLLRRGVAPPLHPESERELLRSVGLGDLLVASPLPERCVSCTAFRAPGGSSGV